MRWKKIAYFKSMLILVFAFFSLETETKLNVKCLIISRGKSTIFDFVLGDLLEGILHFMFHRYGAAAKRIAHRTREKIFSILSKAPKDGKEIRSLALVLLKRSSRESGHDKKHVYRRRHLKPIVNSEASLMG